MRCNSYATCDIEPDGLLNATKAVGKFDDKDKDRISAKTTGTDFLRERERERERQRQMFYALLQQLAVR